MAKKILRLTLHRQWFDQIAIGAKKLEYRTVKAYWKVRLEGRHYDEIHFRNGYSSQSPFMKVEYLGLNQITYDGERVYALQLGKVLEVINWQGPGR
ncbi:MAG: ASCH domain-containing protein [Desulfobacteraceae bacterium]|nr:ASCH domain-containing protein [Desulfobacteraceae bacterium]